MRLASLVLALALPLAGSLSFAQESSQATRYLAEIELHTAEELHGVLQRAEQLLTQGALQPDSQVPVTFLLHGPEVRILLRQNYLQNKPTVDLAARLSALGVVEIKACETWMGGSGITVQELLPFVGTVPYAPTEIKRLTEQQNYLSF